MDKNYKKIIKLLNENNLTRISYEEKGKKWEVERNISTTLIPNQAQLTSTVQNTSLDKLNDLNEEIILSPILGTFYSAPGPGKKPFVKVGDKVKKGQILFIIEAMKVMNEIKATKNGVVKKIMSKDSELVEYNAPVMIVG